MEITLEDIQESPEKFYQMLVESQAELASYKLKYANLLEEIRLAKQYRFGSSSEKNILQSDLFDEAGIELSDEVRDQLDDETEVKSHMRRKHPVRRPLPSWLPREVILHDISDTEKICHCGEHLVRIGEEISEQLKYIPAKVSVIQHVRPKYQQ